jgi:hypothetical protein
MDSLVLGRVHLPDGQSLVGDYIARADGGVFVNPQFTPDPDRGAPYRYDVAPPKTVILTHPGHFPAAASIAAAHGSTIIAPDFIVRDGAPPGVQWMPKFSSPAPGTQFTYSRPDRPVPHAWLKVGPRRLLMSPFTAAEIPRDPKQNFTIVGSPLRRARFQLAMALESWRWYRRARIPFRRLRTVGHRVWWFRVRPLLRRAGLHLTPELPVREMLPPVDQP